MTTTDPGTKTPDEIEHEIAEERARLGRTADELTDRLSVGSLIDEVMARSQAGGGDFARNFGRTVRDNPVPVALIGVGLAWLMAGGQDATDRRDGALGRLVGRDRTRPYWDEDDDALEDLYAERRATAGRTPQTLDERYQADGSTRDHGDLDDDDDVDGVGTRAARAASRAKDGVTDAAASAGAAISDAASSAGDAGRRAGERAAQARREAAWRARNRGRQAASAMDDFIERQPLVAGALAFALGAAAGGLAPNTRAENRLMGRRAEAMRREAGDRLASEARSAKRVAQAAADEAARAADEKAGRADRQTPSGERMVDQAEAHARDVAARARDAAETEAKRQDLGAQIDPKRG